MTETTTEDKPKKSPKKLSKFHRYLIIFAIGVLLSFVATTAIRFALIKDTSVHYHANFALYINGQEDPFKSFTFYEEIAACDASSQTNPKVRSHMHDKNAHLIHVHDGGVTWGQFFENLGYTLGNNLVKTDSGVYISGDDGNKLSFTLNGQAVESVANKLISSEDVLLVNYGKDNPSTLQKRYDSIPRDAPKANVTKDPSACTGGHELTFWSKLKQALGAASEQH
jgi:hypothetical protein